MKYVIALISALVFSASAAAQHAHGQKGPNGGQMEDVAGIHAELMTVGNTIVINVFDESGKPLNTKAYSGAVLVVSGSNRETVSLAPSGSNVLKGDTKGPIAANTAITLTIKTDTGKSGQARFKK